VQLAAVSQRLRAPALHAAEDNNQRICEQEADTLNMLLAGFSKLGVFKEIGYMLVNLKHHHQPARCSLIAFHQPGGRGSDRGEISLSIVFLL